MIKFNLLVNPFTKSILVSARVNKVDCETIINYNELDEWHSFEFEGVEFDLHIEYSISLDITIQGEEEGLFPVSVKLTSKDEF
jgi:hypothetical protein